MNRKNKNLQSRPSEYIAKVRELFLYRHIPDLLLHVEQSKRKPVEDRLSALQLAIYDLDHYLETHWTVNGADLNAFWEKIYLAIDAFGIKRDIAHAMCHEIRQYQTHELNMRDGHWPDEVDFRKLYYYKSCDVRLIRRLIYREQPSLEEQIHFDDWLYYDFVTELNDDIEDVFEDMQTINGNRFLVLTLLSGIDVAREEFKSRLDAFGEEMEQYFSGMEMLPGQKNVYAWTRKRFAETRILLDRQSESQGLKEPREATISKYLNKKSKGN